MKRYLILTVAVLAVLGVTIGLYAQGQGQGAGGRMRGGFNRESQQNAITAIEAELAKIKKSMEASMPAGGAGGFQDMSDEERQKFRDQRTQQREAQAKSLTNIEQQIMILKGGRQLQQEHQAGIEELQAIQAMATSEKATKTAKHIEALIAKRNEELAATAEKLGIRMGRGGQRGGGQGGQGGRQRNN